jgi:hypothetical protein
MSQEEQNQFSDTNILNNTLNEFLKIDQEICKLTNALKARREKKERLSEMILIYLKKNDIELIQLSGQYKGKFIGESKQITTSGFNKENVDKVLINYFENNIEDYQKVKKEINNTLTTKTITKLSMKKNKFNKKENEKMQKQLKDKEISNLMTD